MAKGENITYLFKGDSGNANALPRCSESFWTAVLGLFLFHLGTQGEGASRLKVYQCLPDARRKPWYGLRKTNSYIDLRGVCREHLCVEPPSLKTYQGADATIGGIRPDIVVRLPEARTSASATHILIECKTVGADLRQNQMPDYMKFADFLRAREHRCDVLLVMSVGPEGNVYERAKEVQATCDERFGLLLWEDLFRQMVETNFVLPGFDFKKIVDDGYTDVLDTEVAKDGSL